MHAPLNSEKDPQNLLGEQTLQLAEPELHGDIGSYYDDAMRKQAPELVRLLSELKNERVDTSKHPVIAKYSIRRISPELLYENHYARELANAIVETARQQGLRVSMDGFEPMDDDKLQQAVKNSPEPNRIIQAVRNIIGLNPRESKKDTPIPFDFVLSTKSEFDLSSELPDFQSNVHSYKRLNNSISIVSSP